MGNNWPLGACHLLVLYFSIKPPIVGFEKDLRILGISWEREREEHIRRFSWFIFSLFKFEITFILKISPQHREFEFLWKERKSLEEWLRDVAFASLICKDRYD